jgi:hypothetical protein
LSTLAEVPTRRSLFSPNLYPSWPQTPPWREETVESEPERWGVVRRRVVFVDCESKRVVIAEKDKVGFRVRVEERVPAAWGVLVVSDDLNLNDVSKAPNEEERKKGERVRKRGGRRTP